MRVAILADIHGNLPACEAVLEDIDRMAPDYIVAAGDLALRGAHPRETVELLSDRCDALLMGNTDCYLAGNYLGGAYRERDHWKTELLRWTRDQVLAAVQAEQIGLGVHFRALHLQPYYRQRFGFAPGLCPVAARAPLAGRGRRQDTGKAI